jgi:hypothetical protein
LRETFFNSTFSSVPVHLETCLPPGLPPGLPDLHDREISSTLLSSVNHINYTRKADSLWDRCLPKQDMLSERASKERGRLMRCWPSEFFEVLRKVLALAGSTLRKGFERERQTHKVLAE